MERGGEGRMEGGIRYNRGEIRGKECGWSGREVMAEGGTEGSVV